MTEVADAFKFEHIPRNIDKSSIKVFVNTKGIYSLEYGIVQPQDVFIHIAHKHGNYFGNEGFYNFKQSRSTFSSS